MRFFRLPHFSRALSRPLVRPAITLLIALGLAPSQLAAQQASRSATAGTPPSTTAGTTAHARPGMLVSTEWLAAHQRDPNLVILHVGRRVQFDSAHIAGARPVALSEISTPSGPGRLTLQMPATSELTTWARAQGITDKSRIIVVPQDDTLQSAARVFLTLAYLGAMDRTSMLDGGLKTWRAEGRAVSADAPEIIAPGTFTAHVDSSLIATLTQVEAATKDGRVSIVDARLPRFYAGDGGGFPRPGHIPTAVNIPLNTVSLPSGAFRTPKELQTLFVDAGVPHDKPVITYCHIGQQASLLWFVATLIGYDAHMFDGSFQEWSGTERLPVVVPPAK